MKLKLPKVKIGRKTKGVIAAVVSKLSLKLIQALSDGKLSPQESVEIADLLISVVRDELEE